MSPNKEDSPLTYEVLINHEAQYSIWPNFKALPQGWRIVGKNGDKEACLAYIKEVWADMGSQSPKSKV